MASSLHEAFDWIFFQLMPDAPAEAIVYAVDAGTPNSPNVIITAGVFEGGLEPAGAMLDGPFEKIIAKDWLVQQAEARKSRNAA